MTAHQRRLGRKQQKQIEARLRDTKKRDVDRDCPFYVQKVPINGDNAHQAAPLLPPVEIT